MTYGGVLMAIFLGALDQTVVATALPDIVADLGGFAHYTLSATASGSFLTPMMLAVVSGSVASGQHKVMGVVISAIPFSRFMGGTFGLAILGSVMTGRFASRFFRNLPSEAKSLLSTERLNAMASNPRALASSRAQEDLKNAILRSGADAEQIFNRTMEVLRNSLMAALTEVFLFILAVTALAFIINLFIEEIPLRRQREPDSTPM
jgi:hypothetical protein